MSNRLQSIVRSLPRHLWLVLLLSLLLGVWLRSTNFSRPYLLDAHAFRQADTAGFALGYLQESFNPLDPHTARGPAAARSGKVEAELPLYVWLTVVPAKLRGALTVSAPYLRAWWLGYYLLTSLYLLLLVRKLGEDPEIAVGSVLTFALLPMSVFFTASIQPEGPVLLLAFAFLYHLASYLQRPRLLHEVLLVLCGALMLLTKISYAFVGLPVVYLLWQAGGWRRLLHPRSLVWGALILGLSGAWYYYIHETNTWSWGIWPNTGNGKWSTLSLIRDGKNWDRFGARLVEDILTWPGVALGILGLSFIRTSRSVQLGAAWFVGFALLLLGTIGVNRIHDYYQLPLVVPGALLIPHAVRRMLRSGWAGRAAFAVLLVLFLLSAERSLSPDSKRKGGGYFKEDRYELGGIQLLRKQLPPGARFVAYKDRPQLFFNSGHTGCWGPSRTSIDALERSLTACKARYLLTDAKQSQKMNKLRKDPHTRREFQLLGSKGGWSLFKWQAKHPPGKHPKPKKKKG